MEIGTILGLLGLLFAVASFWWSNWRKGKIIVTMPRTYAAVSQGNVGMLLVRLPLVFYNDGAATIIIQNLRVILEKDGQKSAILYFNQTLSQLDAQQESNWAKQFPVEGRKTLSAICEFLRKPGYFVFSAGSCDVLLEAKFDSDTKWKVASRFKLQTPTKYLESLNSQLNPIVYDNDPDREF